MATLKEIKTTSAKFYIWEDHTKWDFSNDIEFILPE